MCDVSKFSSMYEEMKKLTPEDTLQLILEAETEEQKAFFYNVRQFFVAAKAEASY